MSIGSGVRFIKDHIHFIKIHKLKPIPGNIRHHPCHLVTFYPNDKSNLRRRVPRQCHIVGSFMSCFTNKAWLTLKSLTAWNYEVEINVENFNTLPSSPPQSGLQSELVSISCHLHLASFQISLLQLHLPKHPICRATPWVWPVRNDTRGHSDSAPLLFCVPEINQLLS